MKKTFLVLAVLMLAVPVMAGVTITAARVGTGIPAVITVSYVMDGGDGNIPRAFALDVNMSPANGSTLSPSALDPNFYVALGGTTVEGNTVTWGPQFVNKTASGFTVEMGSLWATNDPCGHTARPKSSGTLFQFTVDKGCDITLAENAIRGGVDSNGVVMEDTTKVFPKSYAKLVGVHVGVAPGVPASILYPPFDPDCNIPVYWAASSGATSYELSRSDNGGVSWPTIYTVTGTYKMDTVPVGLHRYRVRAYNTDGYSDYRTGASDCNSTLSTCYRGGNTADPNWAQWVSLGRPDCWCGTPKGSIYQCDGDSDGAKYGSWRIYSGDLTLLVNNWKKTAAELAADPNMSGTTLKIVGACADTDHKAYGTYRVYTADLTKLTSQWKAPDANFPGNCPR